ncbi:glycosyltransferase [Pengzhenrongella frigida]|uniref:Glycosyltransferase family 1 protein n=1 Tax=Pengzhenrongella frigida TaxID=1259133 RepID=A0A4Q5MYM8_9MICO|nr:glycosyltransferase [Cellulomonas sp. HLT2-17]RYV50766.1 glycosyltransferase family 1 protein [Cellulomonas sp. HLT2-17]
MTRPLRVAVLDHTGQLGGAELALVRLCAALDPERVEVVVVLFSSGPLVARLTALGIEVHVLPLADAIATTGRQEAGTVARAALSVATALPFVVRLARLLRAIGPDVVHTTSLKADLLAVPVAALVRRPLVWHVHDLVNDDYLPPRLGRLVRALARRVPRHVVVNSQATARCLLPLPRGWTLAYPGLAPDQILPTGRADRRREPDPPAVGLVGRVSPTKGQREFVEACAKVAGQFPAVRFRVVGSALFAEAAYERGVRVLADDLGLGDRLEFTGWVPDPGAEMDRLSVLVHASPVPEPFGQVVAEGMARGVPVVATRAGGVTEIVEPGGDHEALGVLVVPGDAADLAQAILDVLGDPDAASRRAEAAWASVVERFPIARTAETVTAVWERVAAGGRGRRRSE